MHKLMSFIKLCTVCIVITYWTCFINGEIEFYKDTEPYKQSKASLNHLDVNRLIRILKSKRHHHQDQQQLDNDQRREQHLLELAFQKQRGILRDDLPERPNIIDALQRKAHDDPLEYIKELDRQKLLPYLEYEPNRRLKPYSVEDEMRARLRSSQLMNDPRLDYPEPQQQLIEPEELQRKLELVAVAVAAAAAAAAKDEHHKSHYHYHQKHHKQKINNNQPEFTYSFPPKSEDSDNGEDRPFAYAPNDPRYYEEDGTESQTADNKFTTTSELLNYATTTPNIAKESTFKDLSTTIKSTTPKNIKPKYNDQVIEFNVQPEISGNLFDIGMLPEPQRRAQHDPLMVSLLNKNSNSDIYFIAIVAGCSAAAMFALVLVSLTWCRLQRNSKAAADVDYPAYGVTGPNKDASPSGDQKLAQSAQMYHFQHQKQQIIAMEKQSAVKDIPSVSDIESDEENEEGDYTVYECPGLAPTGEMEVKNPLFHDDSVTQKSSKGSKKDDV